MIRPFLAALALIAALAGTAFAQTLADEDRARIDARITAFNGMMAGPDYATLFDFTPPRLLSHIVSSFGVTEEILRTETGRQMAETMKQVTLISFGMDLAAATVATTPDGARTYALIPTETVMEAEGVGKLKATSQTLAMEEDGEWYLVRIDDQNQVGLLKTVYPEFADVAFAPGTMVPAE